MVVASTVGRLPVRVVVNEVEKYLDYTTDSRVIDAYKDAMVDVSGLGQQWIVRISARATQR